MALCARVLSLGLACGVLGTRSPPWEGVETAAPTSPASALVETSADAGWSSSRAFVAALSAARVVPPIARGGVLRALPKSEPPRPPLPPPSANVVVEVPPPPAYRRSIADLFNGVRAELGLGDVPRHVGRPAPRHDFVFDVRLRSPEDWREEAVMDRLGFEPGFSVESVDRDSGETLVWDLVEDRGSVTLHSRLSELRQQAQQGEIPLMPLHESIPLLVDLLHGVMRLDHYGLVHMDLTGERAVQLIPDPDGSSRTRAVISDLGKCVSLHPDVGTDGAVPKADGDSGSAGPSAPEAIGAKHNVWQVGQLFGKMCLGEFPTKAYVEAQGGQAFSPGMRGGSVLEHSDLLENEAFVELASRYPDVAGLITGMLWPDPSQRWTADEALDRVRSVMANRFVPMQAPTVLVRRAVTSADVFSEDVKGKALALSWDTDSATPLEGSSLHLNFGSMRAKDSETIAAVMRLRCTRSTDNLRLTFKGGKIGDAGAAALARELASMSTLRKLGLDVEENGITDVGVRSLARALAKLDGVDVLRLRLSKNAITEDGVAAIMKSLPPRLQCLELALDGIGAGDVVAARVSDGLADKGAGALWRLDLQLGNNGITDAGLIKLLHGIFEEQQLAVLSLDFGENQLTDVGAKALSKAVERSLLLQRVELRVTGEKMTASGNAAVAAAQKLTEKRRPPMTPLALETEDHELAAWKPVGLSHLIPQ